MVWVNRLFIFIVGIILTLTTGFGIAVFYPEPIAPLYPAKLTRPSAVNNCYIGSVNENSAECRKILDEESKAVDEYQKQQEVYNDKSSVHTRTTIFLGVIVGAVFAAFGILILKNSSLIAHGFLLAGVLTMILTKLIVLIAAFGSNIKDVDLARDLGYMEFGVLVAVSIMIITLGWFKLGKEN